MVWPDDHFRFRKFGSRRVMELDIEAGGGGVVVARELWGQPDNTPHRAGTHDRALGRALALAFPAGAIGLFIWWVGAERRDQSSRATDRPAPAAADDVADSFFA